MIILPSLVKHTKPRPSRPKFEELYLIPDYEKSKNFWKDVYLFLFSAGVTSPLSKDFHKDINALYGYFGNRMHPSTMEPNYFHLGIEIQTKGKQAVKPILKGRLEYSGYGAVNGYYVLLSHPHIQTEDGYILHTMYCHLKKPLVKFSSYQKMLREISLGSYPLIEISEDTILAYTGVSGINTNKKRALYLQCDFRKYHKKSIVVDPMKFYRKKDYTNISDGMTCPVEFKKQQ